MYVLACLSSNDFKIAFQGLAEDRELSELLVTASLNGYFSFINSNWELEFSVVNSIT